jgi:hypothetical protein
MRFVEPVTLEGRHVRIEPLAHEHADAVRAAAADGELWRLWYTSVPAPAKTTAWIDTALDMRECSELRDRAGPRTISKKRLCDAPEPPSQRSVAHPR